MAVATQVGVGWHGHRRVGVVGRGLGICGWQGRRYGWLSPLRRVGMGLSSGACGLAGASGGCLAEVQVHVVGRGVR